MVVTRTDLPLRLLRRGKVRDVYEVDAETVLLVATDRISAFDVVMREAIPEKGRVLTGLTAWWLELLSGRVEHHLLSVDTRDILGRIPSLAAHEEMLDGRTMLCRRATVFPIECVIRGYLSGSAWKEYSISGTLVGEPLPDDLIESAPLPAPLFSPATKAEEGHDENITIERMRSIVGDAAASELERLTRLIYRIGTEHALGAGIIIADTKLEFGYISGALPSNEEFDASRVILVDEVLTPDSSRFWPAARYRPGGPQPSFDKQPLRDYLDSERRAGRWNGEDPAPTLPGEVIDATSERYQDIYRRLARSPVATGAAN